VSSSSISVGLIPRRSLRLFGRVDLIPRSLLRGSSWVLALPFKLLGMDSDNGSEFINYHLKTFCDQKGIRLTRGRPYKKDDNAHIEQKNFTHVRKILGYLRDDSLAAQKAINELCQNELRIFHNLFLLSMKLIKKSRVGSKLKRSYDKPGLRWSGCSNAPRPIQSRFNSLNGYVIKPIPLNRSNASSIGLSVSLRQPTSVSPQLKQVNSPSPTRSEKQTLSEIAKIFGSELQK